MNWPLPELNWPLPELASTLVDLYLNWPLPELTSTWIDLYLNWSLPELISTWIDLYLNWPLPVFLEPCFCRWHILHTVRTVMTVPLVAYTEPTSTKTLGLTWSRDKTIFKIRTSARPIKPYNCTTTVGLMLWFQIVQLTLNTTIVQFILIDFSILTMIVKPLVTTFNKHF